VGRQLAEAVKRYESKSDVRTRSLELLEQVQMPRPQQVLTAYPHQLSGGMRQRAMIALAVAGRPKLLIADEPTTALDATVQRAILDLLRRLRDELGMALLLVSHDLGAIRSATDRVAVMYAGTLVESGRSSAVLHRPRHPYSAALIASDPSLMERGEQLRSLFGDPPQPGSWPDGCRFHPRCPYALDRCRDAAPEPLDDGTGHLVACVRAGELEL
jgi:oligopeptide/dipeptide ABC transporter ATP-binding protein